MDYSKTLSTITMLNDNDLITVPLLRTILKLVSQTYQGSSVVATRDIALLAPHPFPLPLPEC